MKRFFIITTAAAILAAWGWTSEATAGLGTLKSRVAYRQSQTYPWHGSYYDVPGECPSRWCPADGRKPDALGLGRRRHAR